MSARSSMQARGGGGRGSRTSGQPEQQSERQTDGQGYVGATYEDVLSAPPGKVAEVVGGTLYTHPRPAPPHAIAGSSLGMEVGAPFQKGRGGPGGWWIIDEPELHFDTPAGEDILVPDIAGWRRERMAVAPTTAFFTLTPDWICEILSPSTRHLDLGHKRDIYAREGVPHLWLVDPDVQSLEAFELEGGAWKQIAALTGDVQVSLPPFAAISFPLSGLWS